MLADGSAEERELMMMAWYELWLARNNARETKKIPLDPENPERFAVIGANLDGK